MKRYELLVVCALSVLFLSFAWTADISLQFVHDDAYYYFKTADNIVDGHGVSFDRINPTNGFHPLWMLTLLPVFAVFGHEPQLAISAVLSLQLAFFLGSLFLFHHLTESGFSLPTRVSLALLWFSPHLAKIWFSGMESSLLLLVLLLTTHYLHRTAGHPSTLDGSVRPTLLLGILLGLVFLARLDAVFYVASVVLVVGYRALRSGLALRRVAVNLSGMVGAFAITVLPYFVWNFHVFNHLTPISGHLKTVAPANLGEALTGLTTIFPTARLFDSSVFLIGGVALMLAGVYVLAFRPGARSRFARSFWWVPVFPELIIFSVAHYLYSHLFMTGVLSWYFTAEALVFLLAVGSILEFILGEVRASGRRVFRAAAIAGPCAVAGLVSWFFADKLAVNNSKFFSSRRSTTEWRDTALWIRDRTKEDTIVAGWDCGMFAYFSERRTINLDGLINSYAFLEVLENGAIADYLTSRGVEFVVQPVRALNPRGDYDSPLAELNSSNEVYRSEIVEFVFSPMVFVVWSWPPEINGPVDLDDVSEK